MTIDHDRVDNLRDILIGYSEEESEVLEALILNGIIDRETGMLSNWWMNILNPNLVDVKTVSQEEEAVLSALAKMLIKRQTK
jgi:hypothetical protein